MEGKKIDGEKIDGWLGKNYIIRIILIERKKER